MREHTPGRPDVYAASFSSPAQNAVEKLIKDYDYKKIAKA